MSKIKLVAAVLTIFLLNFVSAFAATSYKLYVEESLSLLLRPWKAKRNVYAGAG